mgnify:CR=1 FL=1
MANEQQYPTLATQPFEPTWALISRPENYPDFRTPGKLEIIWDTNYSNLYKRLSPYANYRDTLIQGFTTEPFYWISPLTAGKGLSALKMAEAKYDSRLFALGSAPIDIIRVTKFLLSGRGIPFLAKQFLLQTGNPYNETRIYNPTSPIVAATMGLTFGNTRPMRFIDIQGGVVGIASSLVGSSIPSLFGSPKTDPPAGTAPKALADDTYIPTATTGGKGLLRAGTAETAEANLIRAWPKDISGAGKSSTFKEAVSKRFKELFQNFRKVRQDGKSYRSDEGTYGLMLAGGNVRFDYIGASYENFEWGQRWFGGGKITRPNNEKVEKPYRIFVEYDKNGTRKTVIRYFDESNYNYGISFTGQVEYVRKESTDENKQGVRYSDHIGLEAKDDKRGEYANSDIMVQYKAYSDPHQQFPTKDGEKVKNTKLLNDTLKRVVNRVKAGGIYDWIPTKEGMSSEDSAIVRTGTGTYDYDRLASNATQRPWGEKPNTIGYSVNLGSLSEYRRGGGKMVSNDLTFDAIKRSLKLPTDGHFDAINTLEVLDQSRKIAKPVLTGWTTWEPYRDDTIALYFYDVVNENYIPFRATIQGINASNNASWEELSFIGRGDKLYSYGGFTRNLSFNIHVVISSLAELIPTWQRINYMLSAVKPANYTVSEYKKITDQFMVPPMFMVTIGDLYREQPILLQSVMMEIPNDAIWETVNSENMTDYSKDKIWTYLNGKIRSKYMSGQFPREANLSFNANLLEKERAVVGGSELGHVARDDNWRQWNESMVPSQGPPNKVHEMLIVDVIAKRDQRMSRQEKEQIDEEIEKYIEEERYISRTGAPRDIDARDVNYQFMA